jgi:transcriptional regulator GlxA family with amidase domain
VVEHGKVITAARVSAGIDMALILLARMHGPEIAMGVQLAIEYDPRPPFDTGSPSKAPAEIVEFVRSQLDALGAPEPASGG